MGEASKLVRFSMVLTVLLCAAAADDFLSLHDISKDYVSRPALKSLGIEISKDLPDWTGTPLEWTSLKVSYVFRVALIALNLLVLIKLRSALRNANKA